jgi:molybdopterin-guanine dinucleotide biosynthesis protein A
LEGLLAGFKGLPTGVTAAYATSCDVPLLKPAFVRRVLALLEGYDIAVPWTEGFHHPLAAAYRPGIVSHIEQLLAADRLRPVYLFERVRTREISADELQDVGLESLKNLNTPEEYRTALEVFEST